jgi:hypothetical protein
LSHPNILALVVARRLPNDKSHGGTTKVIRINRIREGSTLRLIVEGTLSGAWVSELEKCWIELRLSQRDERVTADLSGVSYIDDKGRRLLKRMFSEGAELRATGVMTKGIIEEIAGDVRLSELND